MDEYVAFDANKKENTMFFIYKKESRKTMPSVPDLRPRCGRSASRPRAGLRSSERRRAAPRRSRLLQTFAFLSHALRGRRSLQSRSVPRILKLIRPARCSQDAPAETPGPLREGGGHQVQPQVLPLDPPQARAILLPAPRGWNGLQGLRRYAFSNTYFSNVTN